MSLGARTCRRAGAALSAVATVAAALGIGCSGGGARGGGGLLFSDQGSIVRVAVSDGASTLLVAPVGGNGVELRDPAPSPDGRRIAYVRIAPGKDGRPEGELWVSSADGRDAHAVLQAPGVVVAHPQWLSDGSIAAVAQTPGGVAAERIDAATGARTPLAAGALDVAVSRQRARLALVRPGAAGSPALALADGAGGGAQFVGGLPAWDAVEALAFAPDARRVAVAATPAPGAATTQIWLVAADSAPRQVATLPAPVSGLAFGADGRTLYALTPAALEAVSLQGGAVRRLRGVVGAGALAWGP